jgi:flagellar FliL protein
MPEDTAEQPEPTPAGPVETADQAAPSLFSRLRLVLFALAVVVVECGITWLYIPDAGEAAALAGDAIAADADADVLPPPEEEEPEEAQLEVELGEFSVTSFQPASGTTLRIDFHLFGTIDPADQIAFEEGMGVHKQRIRDQVIRTVRSAELADLTDPGLGLIKRQILEKSNQTLGKPYLESIIFSAFSFIEQ